MKPLSLSNKIKFIQLVDSGAMFKGFQKTFGISKKEFKQHMEYLDFYRLYVETSDKILEIRKSGGNPAEILRLRLSLKEVWETQNE